MAFEFQGRQHFSEKTPFSTDFEQQKERDKFKKEQCAINGVKLIEVLQPTSYDTMKFFESIQRDFKKGGVELKIKQEKVEDMFNAVVSSKQSETMVAFKFFVESKGCKLLSEKMINTTEVLEFECDKGHRFHSSAERFRQKYGTSYNSKESKMIPHACNQCKAELNPSKTRTMYTRKDYEEIGKSKGWTLTSEKIGGKYEMVNWQCQNGHERSVALRSMLSPAFRSNCAACASMKTSILPESVLNGGQTNVSSTIESAGNEQEKEDSSEQVMARQMLVDLTQTMCDLAHKAGQYASMLKSPEVATEYERLKAVVLGLSSATNTRGRKLT